MELIGQEGLALLWGEVFALLLLGIIMGILLHRYCLSMCFEERDHKTRRSRSRGPVTQMEDSFEVVLVDDDHLGGRQPTYTQVKNQSTQFYQSPNHKILCKNVYDTLKEIDKPFRCRGASYCDYWHPKPNQRTSLEMVIVKRLLSAKQTIDLCMYRLSYRNFTDLLIEMKNKNVRVRVIVDQGREGEDTKAHNEELSRLRGAKIEIRSPDDAASSKQGLMHNKYVVIDSKRTLQGSMNWSRNAITSNHELLMDSTDENIVRQMVQAFESLWAKSHLFK